MDTTTAFDSGISFPVRLESEHVSEAARLLIPKGMPHFALTSEAQSASVTVL